MNLVEQMLSKRIDSLVAESPRLHEILSELMESKHVGSVRGSLKHRDLYARIGKTHFGKDHMEKVAGHAKAGFRVLQRDFSHKLNGVITQYYRLNQKHLEAQATYRSGEIIRRMSPKERGIPKSQRRGSPMARAPGKTMNRGHTVKTRSALNAKVSEMKKIFRSSYDRAYRLGLGSTYGSGHDSQALLSPEEGRWLESAVRHEARYFNKFLEQIRRGQSPASLQKRVDMYAQTLESIFRAGQAKGQHPHVEIHWRVNSELENCPACIKLAAEGPYTKDTLPTTPKAGATPCKFNCGCELEFVQTDQVRSDKRRQGGLSHKYAMSKIRRSR